MKKNTKETGSLGEGIAARFLARKGFRIIAQNYLKPWGEIDIIAEKGGIYRFLEVKTVSRENLPDISHETNGYRPEEQIHPQKLKKIVRTAETYILENNIENEYQIDAVGVFLDHKNRVGRCRLFENVL